MKPTMFIGSSAEALPVAEAVHSLMEGKGVESTLWNNGAFGMNTSGLESLMRASERFDYACFILRRDDLARSRGKKLFTVRDNVILEIGLFLGALGRERVFIIFERGNKPDLPSDLNGINFLSYDGSRADGSLKSALVSACLEIQDAVRRLGRRSGGRGAPAAGASDAPFRVSPLDESNSRWQNMTARLDRCRRGEVVRFISVTGKNFLLPAFQEGEAVASRLGPKALSRGVRLRGLVLDPGGREAEFRSTIESPDASRARRLLVRDAREVANLPLYYKESYGLGPGVINNLELKYSQVGLSFGLWLFSDVAFVEPFHFGKRKGVHHLCGFAQVAVDRGQEEFDLLEKHFSVLWRHAKHVPWHGRRAAR